jgi:hypothetical protein
MYFINSNAPDVIRCLMSHVQPCALPGVLGTRHLAQQGKSGRPGAQKLRFVMVEVFIMVKSMTVRLGEIDATRGDLTSMRQRPHKVRSVRQVGGRSEWKAMQSVTGDGNSRKTMR